MVTMSDGPKLYTNKPKKAHLKHHQQKHQASSPTPSSSASMSSSTPPGTAAAPRPPKESFFRRYKFMLPLLLAVNFSIGVYFFTRKKEDNVDEEGQVPNFPSTAVSTSAVTATVTEKPLTSPPIIEPPKPREPIPDNQQRELFKWILEEKRKVKPKDPEEKKRIDEEKALLKQFIRAKSNPSL